MTQAFDIDRARFNMIEQQIRPWDVHDPAVLGLLGSVRREEFVPAAHRSLAFADLEIPLPEGQCMLAPRIEARLLQDARIQPHERVLEIGAGSGFMAALLAHRAQQVVSLDIRPALVDLARANLSRCGVRNVDVRMGDGAALDSAIGSFDVILLSGSVASVPQNLLRHLRIGGRLLALVGDDLIMRATVVAHVQDGRFESHQPWDCAAPRLERFEAASAFTF